MTKSKLSIIYAAVSLIGAALALALAVQSAVASPPNYAVAGGLSFQGLLWLATGLAILREHRKAVALVWTTTIIAGIGTIAHGLKPVEIAVFCLLVCFSVWFQLSRKTAAQQGQANLVNRYQHFPKWQRATIAIVIIFSLLALGFAGGVVAQRTGSKSFHEQAHSAQTPNSAGVDEYREGESVAISPNGDQLTFPGRNWSELAREGSPSLAECREHFRWWLNRIFDLDTLTYSLENLSHMTDHELRDSQMIIADCMIGGDYRLSSRRIRLTERELRVAYWASDTIRLEIERRASK